MKTIYNFPNLKTKKIYAVRHGLSTLSKRGYGRGVLTANLLPEGKGPIEKLAVYLKQTGESYNVASPVKRCQQTVEIISIVTGKQFKLDKRLHERHKETFTQFKARVVSFLQDLEKISDDTIVICTHAIVIAAIRHFLKNGVFTEKYKNDYTLPGELDVWTNGDYQTISFN